MFRYLSLFCLHLVVLLGDVLGNTSVKSRIKRTLSVQRLSELSLEDLSLELVTKHRFKVVFDIQNDLSNESGLKTRLAHRKSRLCKYLGRTRDHCSNIKSIGQPITHNSRRVAQGAWMKDPLKIMGSRTVFTMEHFSGRNVVEEFKNINKFKAGIPFKTYKLPYNWDGTGAVVYGPYLYYNRANTAHIVKYNLQTEREEAQITVSGYKPRKNWYQWGGYSGMDLAVDEQGLWVLWGSTGNNKKLYAYKIDVYNNVVTHTWALKTGKHNLFTTKNWVEPKSSELLTNTLSTEPMSSMGNAFVACGVIYCIDSYNSNSTAINFAYDTKTGKQWNPNIHFTNQYGYNSMVDYNPRERVLYAWDLGRQVTYPITFEEPL